MKHLFRILILFIFVLSSCQKKSSQVDDISSSGETIQTGQITLSQAYDLLQSELGIKLLSPNQQTNSESVNTLSTSCPAYPSINSLKSYFTFRASSSENTPVRGSSIAIRYNFKKGMTYNISFSTSNVARGTKGKPHSSQYNNPSLQAALANSSNFITDCNGSINLSTLGLPYHNIGTITPQIHPYGSADFTPTYTSKSMTFVADNCYEYFWLNAVAPTGDYSNEFDIAGFTIKEVGSGLIIDGASNFTNGNQEIFKVKLGGYTVSDSFQWETTGKLEIVGSNVGSSVTVKPTGSFYHGSIIAKELGCGVIAQKDFGIPPSQYSNYITLVQNGVLNPAYTAQMPSFSLIVSPPLQGNVKITGTLWNLDSNWATMWRIKDQILNITQVNSSFTSGKVTAEFLIDNVKYTKTLNVKLDQLP
jgi:hypothetical protein